MGGAGVDGQSGAPAMLTLPQEQRKRKIVGKVGLGVWGCLPDREAVVWIDPLQQTVQL